MDASLSSSAGEGAQPSAIQSGHWLPALRPNNDDESEEDSPPHEPSQTSRNAKPNAGEHDTNTSSAEDTLDFREGTDEEEVLLSEATHSQPQGGGESSTAPSASATDGARQAEEEEMVSEDDDERLDPSWGFKRMSTAQILASADRSTAFPSFGTPVQDNTAFFAQKAPEPTQESSVHPQERVRISGNSAPSAGQADMRPDNGDYPSEGADPEPEELKDTPLFASGPSLEEAAESRFEEGLSLMAHASTQGPTEEPTQMAGHDHNQASADTEEDISFFSNINTSAQNITMAPELTRKSTFSVVDSLHVQLKPASERSPAQPDSPQRTETQHADEERAFLTAADVEEEAAAGDVEDSWKAILDDDEFLVDDPDDLLPDSQPGSPSSFLAALQEEGVETDAATDSPQAAAMGAVQQSPPPVRRLQRQSSSNPYAPHQPSTSELAQLSPTTHSNVGFPRPGFGPMNSFQAHLQQRPNMPRAESFADQAKGGYKSPYDLPMELSKPKKRPAMPQLPPSNKSMPPPPRSSSIPDKQLQSPFSPSAPGFPAAANTPSQPSAPIPQQRNEIAAVPPANSAKQKSGSSTFFEELPIATKPKAGSGHGRFTPQQPQQMPPPQLLPQSPPKTRVPQPQPSPPRQPDPYTQFQLRPPERIDPFTNMPIQSSGPQAPAAQSARYSPAPPATLTGPRPGPSPRYSPAPPSQQSNAPAASRYASQPVAAPPPQQPQQPPGLNRTISQPPPTLPTAMPPLPFQPRTSSPLAFQRNSIDASIPEDSATAIPPRPGLGPPQYSSARITSPPTSIGGPAPAQQAKHYAPPPDAVAPVGTIAGPRRSQTQSPSKQKARPSIAMPNSDFFTRPASAHGQMSPTRAYSQMDSILPPRTNVQARGLVSELDFVQPTDGTQNDPLQRWRGSPIFRFGLGGSVVSTFPKHIPRYSAGAVRPQLKSVGGEVNLRAGKDVIPLPEHLSSFPGPLRGKSKKRDVLAWLAAYVTKIEADASFVLPSQGLPDSRKRHQEKILLWKIVTSLVEHEGVLGGNADALKSINQILTPEIYHLDESTATQYRDDMISPQGTYRPRGASLKMESVDPMAMEAIRKHLLRGARQEAVWFAVDKRLWSHAILIASTLSRDVWGQVVQEFVKHEVRPAGENTEALSALYAIFGGNLDESIDQLVPPSARAGLQMVSKIEHGGPTKNALDGLDKWKETLSLVLNNRSPSDQGALFALGRLLQDYGRVEAAHICFLFARNASTPTLIGGADDPLASIVLLGADHKKQPFDFARDHEAILLTEVYEYATLVLPGAATSFMPYLSAYKLRRASLLADSGLKVEAQSYCDALMATMKFTKAPAYYHPVFLGELEDLSNRLKQAPVQASASWIAKPSMEKVGGSILSKFSSFVVGDDSDTESKGSGRDVSESGPFAKMAGTPSLSRTGSQSDIYGSYPTAGSAPIPLPTTLAGSRYAPNGLTSARSSSELARGRPSLDSQRSPPTSSYGQPMRPSPYEPINMLQQSQVSPPSNPYHPNSFGASPPTQNYQATPPQSSYMPESSPARHAMQPRQESYIPTPPPEQLQSVSYEPNSFDGQASQPPVSESQGFGDAVGPAQSSFDGPAPPYEQPTQSYGYGYEPPETEYNPWVPEPDSPEEPRPKKKSFMNDDNDFPRASKSQYRPQDTSSSDQPALTADEKARRAANDAAAEAAFRAVAEADADRAAGKSNDKQGKAKPSGWFGGWLGGAKKTDSLDTAPAQSSSKGGDAKVYRAKLGESKMKLYYDEKLKKWVNPDNPDAALKATATPPPPPRSGSTPQAPGAGPPMGPPRSLSNLGAAAAPPPQSGSPAMMGGAQMSNSPSLQPPGSGPPSRAATPASGGSGSGGYPGGVSATLPPSVNASLSEGGGGGGGLGLAPPSSGPPSRPGTAMSNASNDPSLDDLLGPGSAGAGMGRKSVKGKKGAKRYVDVMAK